VWQAGCPGQEEGRAKEEHGPARPGKREWQGARKRMPRSAQAPGSRGWKKVTQQRARIGGGEEGDRVRWCWRADAACGQRAVGRRAGQLAVPGLSTGAVRAAAAAGMPGVRAQPRRRRGSGIADRSPVTRDDVLCLSRSTGQKQTRAAAEMNGLHDGRAHPSPRSHACARP